MSGSNDNKYLISEDGIKQGIDAFRGFISSGDTQEVINLISNATKISKGIKLVVDIRNWHIAKKIEKFTRTIQNQEFSKEQFQKLIDKYGEDKVQENVIISLDTMRSEEQAHAFSYLFAALLREDLSWDRFSELQNILEKLDPIALDADFNDKDPSYRLVSVGLAYIQTVYDGVKTVPNGSLYNDFTKYIITPYRDEKDAQS